jgi:hypothetical protein
MAQRLHDAVLKGPQSPEGTKPTLAKGPVKKSGRSSYDVWASREGSGTGNSKKQLRQIYKGGGMAGEVEHPERGLKNGGVKYGKK